MRRREFIQHTAAAAAGGAAGSYVAPAKAQAHADTLITLSESGTNSLDVMGIGTNRPGYESSWNTHDRLLTYGVKKVPEGNDYYDHSKLEPELAKSWDAGDMSITFKLRKDAKFHDGSPVTARDVKWSFDRAVSIGGAASFQFAAGSMQKPEQFVAVDDHTFRLDFLRKDKFTLPDLAVPTACVFNSELAKKHASAQDPWAQEWLKTNEAGSGAYRVEKWTPGQELIYQRFDDWKSGPLPKIKRVIWRIVPSAGNRRALLERGDADISFDLPPKDVSQMVRDKKLDSDQQPDRKRTRLYRHERQDSAVRQYQGPSGSRLRDPLSEDHGCGDVRTRQTDVRRPGRGDEYRLAAAEPLCDRSRQGKAIAHRGRVPERVRDNAILRPRLRRHPRTAE